MPIHGGEPGDVVVISLRGPLPEGLLLHGVGVTAPDNILGKLCNFTGGPSPFIDRVPIRILTFG
jgi:hypothetical protein